MKAGRLRVLAITSARRPSQLPDVPTFVESGYKELATGYAYGMGAGQNAGNSRFRLKSEIVRIIGLPDVKTVCAGILFITWRRHAKPTA